MNQEPSQKIGENIFLIHIEKKIDQIEILRNKKRLTVKYREPFLD